MCHTIVQKHKEVSLWGKVVVLQRGHGGDFDTPVVAIFRGSVSRGSAEEMKKEGRAVEVIVPYVSGVDLRSENTGTLNRQPIPSGSALMGVLSEMKASDVPVLHVVYDEASEEQYRRLGCESMPVVLERRLEQDDWIRWQRCNPPSPGEEVWTTDQFIVRKGRYEWDPLDWDPEVNEGKERWVDLDGSAITVRYWMHAADEHEPAPPRLLYRHFEMPV